MEWFGDLAPTMQALVATCFTWGVTAMLGFAVMMTMDVALG